MNNYSDILSFLRGGGQPNYSGVMGQINQLIAAKLRKMQPQTNYFGANKVPIMDNQITSGFIDPMGNYHQGEGNF